MNRKTQRQDKTERQKELEDKEYLGEPGIGGGPGRAGGNLQREIGAEDTLKRSFERPAGVTRVHKGDEREKVNARQGERKQRRRD